MLNDLKFLLNAEQSNGSQSGMIFIPPVDKYLQTFLVVMTCG